MSTDTDIERIIERLKDASETHPNLCNLWANYLLLKRTSYYNALDQVTNMLENIDGTEDPDHNTLIALFTISRLSRPSNR